MLDENKKLIKEVIEATEEMKLFSPKTINSNYIIEINDYDEAEFLAYENLQYEINSEKGYSWVDLRELVMSEVYEEKYRIENYQEFQEEMNEFKRLLDKNLKISDEYIDSLDDVYSDLSDCIICRGLYGKNNSIFEKMYYIYKSGGWPCGWSGNYPEGKLIVFYPREE
ncbi:hypothetical protein [Oceanirhabdus sp. W0125-5]|uniref:hypothetical protein n=1 Tax=Oceanirhabdus sp. W0125-5 TaxID=2999116 RepID=UPI0022F2AFBF|nr:hypothetical protein [Oceanirhabdus sp. W0125-5]WBW96127.1 hypothetical protein OW730_20900 [Oceanirhabdus sp. W0125-5]